VMRLTWSSSAPALSARFRNVDRDSYWSWIERSGVVRCTLNCL
jgi:hypothetical protein